MVFSVQYLWFRHVFLLSEEDSRAIQSMAVELLADKKLEVQELAATTLSGLLQVQLHWHISTPWLTVFR